MHYHYGIRPPKPQWGWPFGPNSIMVVYMDPLGELSDLAGFESKGTHTKKPKPLSPN